MLIVLDLRLKAKKLYHFHSRAVKRHKQAFASSTFRDIFCYRKSIFHSYCAYMFYT